MTPHFPNPAEGPEPEKAFGNVPAPEEQSAGAREMGADALDTLLGQLRDPVLRPGFSDRVIHCIQPEEVNAVGQVAAPWRRAGMALLGSAAVLALGMGILRWSAPVANEVALAPEEETLLNALRSTDMTASDLVVVAQLGEVLEEELAALTTPWLDPQ